MNDLDAIVNIDIIFFSLKLISVLRTIN